MLERQAAARHAAEQQAAAAAAAAEAARSTAKLDAWALQAEAAIKREREKNREPLRFAWARAQTKVDASRKVALGGLFVAVPDRDVAS